jgi:hypothetical protein
MDDRKFSKVWSEIIKSLYNSSCIDLTYHFHRFEMYSGSFLNGHKNIKSLLRSSLRSVPRVGDGDTQAL